MIYARAGISLGAHKREMVYSRLARRLRALGQQEFRVYLDGLENEPAAPEWEDFVNALTTNLTAFFRESHHFPILADFARQRGGPVSVWCCAASTGEEPYSIAMTLVESLGARPGQPGASHRYRYQLPAARARGRLSVRAGGQAGPGAPEAVFHARTRRQ
ncbi:chemotaxis protein methyltransferase [Bordetella pertussis]|nr:chemotaxis protein methyltransferase [Bordetella pertussis]CFW46509.1 chemotaxis protein methyltransferase [Bordetella pertussis]